MDMEPQQAIPMSKMDRTRLSSTPWGPFIYYVITFLGFLDPPPPPLRQHVFSTKNKQKLAFSDPPPPYKCLRNI